MPDEVRLTAAFLLSVSAAYLLTPAAIRAARRLKFFDCPEGYKAHRVPTPYLGGLAVLAGTIAASVVFARQAVGFEIILACAIAIAIVGTVDDRIALPPLWRVSAETGCAIALWSFDLGWTGFGSDIANLAVTVFWVVGIVNAFNLMDNMDGAAASVGAVASASAGVVLMLNGNVLLGALGFALAGGCVGFLPHNLRIRGRARIFLGDGGSMAIGFLVAAIIMAGSPADVRGWEALIVGCGLVALPIFDTTLVVVSRVRRGVPVFRGGRDHLTHRLSTLVGSPARVVVLVVGAQTAFAAGAAVASQVGESGALGLLLVCAVLLALGIVILEARTIRGELSRTW